MIGIRKAALFAVSFFAATATASHGNKVAIVPRSVQHHHLHALRSLDTRAPSAEIDVGAQIQTILKDAHAEIVPFLTTVNASVKLDAGSQISLEVVADIEAKFNKVCEKLNVTLTALLELEDKLDGGVELDLITKTAIALQLELILVDVTTVAAQVKIAAGGHLTGNITALLKVFLHFRLKIQIIIGEILCVCADICIGLKLVLSGLLGFVVELLAFVDFSGLIAKLHLDIGAIGVGAIDL